MTPVGLRLHLEAYRSSTVSFLVLAGRIVPLCGRDKRRSVAVEQTLCTVQACSVAEKAVGGGNRQPGSLDAEPINGLFCVVVLVAGTTRKCWWQPNRTGTGREGGRRARATCLEGSICNRQIDNWRVDDTRLAERSCQTAKTIRRADGVGGTNLRWVANHAAADNLVFDLFAPVIRVAVRGMKKRVLSVVG